MPRTRRRIALLLAVAGLASSRLAAAQASTFRIVPGLSQASYAVDEVFFNENNRLFTAVGVTPAISGAILLDTARPGESRLVEILVDLRPLKSDSERRDRALRERFLESNKFPYARLSGSALRDMPAAVVEGAPFSFTISGDLALHGTSRAAVWRGTATLARDTLRGTARTRVKMSAFGIEVPSLLSLRSADDVNLEIRFVAVPTREREYQ